MPPSDPCGLIVNGSCAPTAMPGIVFDALRMLGKPLPPLSVKPAYALRILPWLLRFLAESHRAKVEQNARHLHALTNRAIEGWRRLTDDTDLSTLIDGDGWMKVYESQQVFAATRNARALMDANGTPYEILSATDIQELEPRLAPIFERGIYQSDSLKLTNPQKMVTGMVDLLVSRGGTFRRFDVRSIRIAGDTLELLDAGMTMTVDKAVLAAGARIHIEERQDAVCIRPSASWHYTS